MKGKIPIGDARRISRERACPMVLVFGIEEGGERFTVTTYGATKKLCKLAASYAEQFADAVMKGSVFAPEFEPVELPEEPAMFSGKRACD